MDDATHEEQAEIVPAYGGCFVRRGNDVKFVPGKNMLPLPVLPGDECVDTPPLVTPAVDFATITREVSTS